MLGNEGFVFMGFGVLFSGDLVWQLTADVDVGGLGVHGVSHDQATFQQLHGVMPHDLAVLACACTRRLHDERTVALKLLHKHTAARSHARTGLALVRVDHEVGRLAGQLLVWRRHEAVFETRWKAGAAAAAQAGLLDAVDDPRGALVNKVFGSVPVAALQRTCGKKTSRSCVCGCNTQRAPCRPKSPSP